VKTVTIELAEREAKLVLEMAERIADGLLHNFGNCESYATIAGTLRDALIEAIEPAPEPDEVVLPRERELLKGFFLDNAKLDDPTCYPGRFRDERHQWIFWAMSIVHFDNAEPVDILTVSELLLRRAKLVNAGGAQYIRGLLD
jgi:DnaB-like helicase N terminal domain